ncbi:Mss4-like protein [Aspergillus insuetus]
MSSSTQSATCAWGAVRLSYTGSPVGKCICHCLSCRKASGSTNALNLIVPAAKISIVSEAELGQFSYTANNGNRVTRYFCRRCGINMYSDGEGAPGVHFVRAGTLDDEGGLEKSRPEVEIFVSRRAAWLAEVEGCGQKLEM